jgi:hypothetical protein
MASVSRTARELFSSRALRPSEDVLIPLLDAPSASHVRKNALLLLVRLGKWTGLRWALYALEAPLHPGRERAMLHLQGWLGASNKSFARPTREEVDAIGGALERLKQELPSKMVEEIRWILDREAPQPLGH